MVDIANAFNQMEVIVTALMTIAIILVIAIVTLSKLKATLDTGSAEANATQEIIDQVITVVGFLGIVVIAGVGMVLYGMVKAAKRTYG
jgi:hypothetical protein